MQWRMLGRRSMSMSIEGWLGDQFILSRTFRMVDLGRKIPRLRRRQIGAEGEELEMNWYWCRQNERPSRGVGIWTRRGGSSVTGNREEMVGVKVSKSKKWG